MFFNKNKKINLRNKPNGSTSLNTGKNYLLPVTRTGKGRQNFQKFFLCYNLTTYIKLRWAPIQTQILSILKIYFIKAKF